MAHLPNPKLHIALVPLLALALGASLLGAQTALADDAATTYLSVYGPGANIGAAVAVQRPAAGGWTTVPGWTGNLTDSTTEGVLFTRWAVDPSLYGQGPFRAVRLSLDQKSIVGVSDMFYLPVTGGINLAVTLGPAAGMAVGQPAATQLLGKTLPAGPKAPPLLKAIVSTSSTMCYNGDCANAAITAEIDGEPLNSWIAVEWQNALGVWRPVRNWEGPADWFELSGRLHKQWGVLPSIYGQGPFRWAVYSGPNGAVLGVGPSFYLPTADRENEITVLSP
jgi:hypothetical protein